MVRLRIFTNRRRVFADELLITGKTGKEQHCLMPDNSLMTAVSGDHEREMGFRPALVAALESQ